MFKDTTRNERVLIDSVMNCIMTNVEIGCKLISDSYEDFFGEAEQKDIPAIDAERLGRVIYSATSLIFDALAEYYVEVGYDTENSVHDLIRRGRRAAQIIEVDTRTEEARKVLPLSTIRRAGDMPDADALAYLDKQEAKAVGKTEAQETSHED